MIIQVTITVHISKVVAMVGEIRTKVEHWDTFIGDVEERFTRRTKDPQPTSGVVDGNY